MKVNTHLTNLSKLFEVVINKIVSEKTIDKMNLKFQQAYGNAQEIFKQN